MMIEGVLASDEKDAANSCIGLWQSIFALLSTLLVIGGQETFVAICPIVVKHWKIIGGLCIVLTFYNGIASIVTYFQYLHIFPSIGIAALNIRRNSEQVEF